MQSKTITIVMLLALFLFTPNLITNAQVTLGNTEESEEGALLQLKNLPKTEENGLTNATKGLMMPRVLLTKKYELMPMFSDNQGDYNNDKANIDSEHTGLLVYNTQANTSELICKGMNVWNGREWQCLSQPSYTIDCNSVKIQGVGKKDQPLDPAKHYIELDINVDDSSVGLLYKITTNTVDGISFSASGILDAAGTKTIILKGKGTPRSYDTKYLTITTNSTSSDATCGAEFFMVLPMKGIFSFGYYQNSAGYLGQTGSDLRKMMDAPQNFGEQNDSKVKLERYSSTQTFYPFNIISGLNAYNPDKIKEILDTKPDIVFTGFDLDLSAKATLASYLVDYVKAGGVLIFICERQTMSKAFFEALYPERTINYHWTTTNTLSFYNTDNDFLNGPFGNIKSKLWGNDTAGAIALSGIPAEDIEVLSTNLNGYPVIFKHKKYNLVYIGEGGFNAMASTSPANTISYPFAIDGQGTPISRTGFYGGTSVENSCFMANVLAWAVYQAQFHGINTPKE